MCGEKWDQQAFQEKRILVGCHWVFKIICNGVYQTRLVAKGFCQLQGLDFMDNFSPVVNDGTFQVVITQMTIEWDAKIVDIDRQCLFKLGTGT